MNPSLFDTLKLKFYKQKYQLLIGGSLIKNKNLKFID